ncbi:MAG: hypothetical protein SGJ27_22740 [Candidatus Melainabacteria bacterium]|nr:hypothetical protein [Candidatus Melainabacteria bacterium]
MIPKQAIKVILSLLVCYQTITSAAAFEEDFGERGLNIGNDWVIYVEAKNKKEFLNYKGSHLNPITNLRVIYRKTPRHSSDADITPRTYEDLWYHQGRALGSRRYCKLEIDETKRGIVIFRNSEDAVREPRAVANSIVKLTVELALKNVVCLGFVVPKEMYNDVILDLAHFGFTNKPTLKLGGMQTSIYLMSNPSGLETDLYFQKWR